MSELLDELPTAHLEYGLRNGTVGDWLVLGPLTARLVEPINVHSHVARQLALNTIFVDADEIVPLPAERATSSVTVAEGVTLQGMWRVVNTLEDGWVDLAQNLSEASTLCAWVYAQVVLPQRVMTPLLLTVASPAQLWVNGAAVFSYDELPDLPTTMAFDAPLDEGTNEILIRVANVGIGDMAMMVALQIPATEGVVTLPTLLEPVARRQKLYAVMEKAYLAQAVYSREERIVLRWPTDMKMIDALTARLQMPNGRILGEANPMVQKGAKVDFGEATQFPDGEYEVLLLPQFEEYYVHNMRVQRRLPLQIRNGKWSTLYYGSHAERRQEALEDAARRSGELYAEIAKSALGEWDALRHEVIEQALAQVSQRSFGYEMALLALMGWVARMGDLPDFPQEVAWALEESVPLVLDHFDERTGIIFTTCHLLAGQLYAQRTFADLNTGEWHVVEAEARLLLWLTATAQSGLPGGESERAYAEAILVLSHLVDLARSDEVAEMAAAVLDKVAYLLALQSFLGVWGGSRDDGDMEWLLSARLGPLCGVARLWWGQGAYNAYCAATVALACAENYLLPEIVAAVALDRQQENWLQRQDAPLLMSGRPQVNRAAYRSGDYLLASMQGDFAAGTRALLWQATLGPDAVIFGNRPACSSEHTVWAQNYWRGNAAPVRVAQWKELLVVAYLPAEEPLLNFSHAYIPQAAFDEVRIGEGWAMARKGNGYVALTATGGVEAATEGRTAKLELRAAGESIWLVHVGRAAHDGTFAQFVEKVLALPLALNHERVEITSLRGEHVRFATSSPLGEALIVGGVAQPLTDFPHLASIYGGAETMPATAVEIQYQEHLMRLDFGTAQTPAAT
jgi:hypothetical protein